jgi:hypothetical protein
MLSPFLFRPQQKFAVKGMKGSRVTHYSFGSLKEREALAVFRVELHRAYDIFESH